jgi:dethiobiotin synthetase
MGVPAGMRGLFFSGTDTGVGKTHVTAAVARRLRSQGRAVRVSKPIATGIPWHDGERRAEDTLTLAEAAGERDLDRVTPWAFPEPAAPPIAARCAGASLDLGAVADAVRRCYGEATVLLVEGVGGLLCPLTENASVADLVAELALPLVIVARRSLGTLNHTLLAVEAAQRRELPLAGVVISETTPMRGLAEKTAPDELRRRGVPVLAVLPHGGGPEALAKVDWWELAAWSFGSRHSSFVGDLHTSGE